MASLAYEGDSNKETLIYLLITLVHGDTLLRTDILVIGGGAAGLRAAIEAKRRGMKVKLASKAPIGYASSTLYAGGGFRAAIGNYCKGTHFKETVIGGKHLNDQELVWKLVREAPDRLAELESFGVSIKFGEKGISVSNGLLTPGKGLVSPMAYYAQKLGVDFIEGVMAIDLLFNDFVYGVIFFDIRKGRIFPILSKAVVLATGGYSQLLARNDNPVRVSGDGCAMALRAGVHLIDLEFIQFYPLGLAEEGEVGFHFPTVFGRLVNNLGEDVLVKYGFNKPLSKVKVENRDMLSRVMWNEILNGKGFNKALLIDLTNISYENFLKYLSSRAYACARHLTRHPNFNPFKIKVAPTAHFTMGGIKINVDCETNIPGLFACGEVSSGVHGANRLGGNALTEAIVFGSRAGYNAGKWAGIIDHRIIDTSYINKVKNIISCFKNGKSSIIELKKRLKNEMWEKCGLIRNKEKLSELLDFIRENKGLFKEVYAKNNFNVMEAFELQNMFELAEAVVISALYREESRGAHFRSDFPESRDEVWLKRLEIKKPKDELLVNILPVTRKMSC